MPEIKKIAAAILISTASFSASTAYAASVSPTAVQPSITSATPEFVYTYLLGEIAGQRGDVTLASQLFLDLAKKPVMCA